VSDAAHAYWVIPASLFAAAVLAVVPIDRALAWWRPEWLLLVLVYWTIALPHRVGLVTALCVGLPLDVMEGAPLGQNMLALAFVVVLARLMYQRLRIFSLGQQALVLFVLTGMHQLIEQWLQGLQGLQAGGATGFRFLLPALTSALLWPPVFLLLRGLRRSFRVS
jgi:rod shape-determining protein MreD